MGLADRFGGIAEKARKAVGENADRIGSGLDKAAAVADRRTGGKHSDKIQRGVRVAKDRLAEQRQPRGDGPMAP